MSVFGRRVGSLSDTATGESTSLAPARQASLSTQGSDRHARLHSTASQRLQAAVVSNPAALLRQARSKRRAVPPEAPDLGDPRRKTPQTSDDAPLRALRHLTAVGVVSSLGIVDVQATKIKTDSAAIGNGSISALNVVTTPNPRGHIRERDHVWIFQCR
jgi:hypothetical protein